LNEFNFEETEEMTQFLALVDWIKTKARPLFVRLQRRPRPIFFKPREIEVLDRR
jgi:hypothetical protein